MKRGSKQNKLFVIVDSCSQKARVYESVEGWVKDFMKRNDNLDKLIQDLENKDGPEWAESFVEEKCRKFLFDGKEELLRAFKNLPYRADAIDIQEFLSMYDGDEGYYKATLVK